MQQEKVRRPREKRARWHPKLGNSVVREVDGSPSNGGTRGSREEGTFAGTAVRHFNVMHHMMGKACTIWSKETGVIRNPADQIEVIRPDDERERYLSTEEIHALKATLDGKDLSSWYARDQPNVLPAAHDHSACAHHWYADG